MAVGCAKKQDKKAKNSASCPTRRGRRRISGFRRALTLLRSRPRYVGYVCLCFLRENPRESDRQDRLWRRAESMTADVTELRATLRKKKKKKRRRKKENVAASELPRVLYRSGGSCYSHRAFSAPHKTIHFSHRAFTLCTYVIRFFMPRQLRVP